MIKIRSTLFFWTNKAKFKEVRMASKKSSNLVFVYGTLKKNEPNHHWLLNTSNGHAEYVGEAEMQNKYPLIIGSKYNIPFLLYSPGQGHRVRGEVYDVDSTMLGKLDTLEEHPHFYERMKDEVLLDQGNSQKTYECWVYFIKKFKPELLSKKFFTSYSSKGEHGLEYVQSKSSCATKGVKMPTYGNGTQFMPYWRPDVKNFEHSNTNTLEAPAGTIKKSQSPAFRPEFVPLWRPVQGNESLLTFESLESFEAPPKAEQLTSGIFMPFWQRVDLADTDIAIDSYGSAMKIKFRHVFMPLWQRVVETEYDTTTEEATLEDLNNDVAVTKSGTSKGSAVL